ncbi:MAG: hypothetical protein U0R81_05670 [Mycobacterium sp.]
MLEYQRRLSAGHIGVGVEMIDDESPQIIGVACGDVIESSTQGLPLDRHFFTIEPQQF